MESVPGHLSDLAAGASAALLASIWQGVLLTGCVALCLRMVPRLSASVRSVVWLSVFVVVGALNLVWLGASSGGSFAGQGGGLRLDVRWGFGLAAAWAALTFARLARLSAGAVRLSGIARRAVRLPVALGEAPGRQEPPVYSSPDVQRPVVVGFLAPRILLPAGLRERLSVAEFKAILLHEREHLRRYDNWSNLLQKIGLALMPLNPVLVWVERRLCQERELACDDHVVRQTRARRAYAACLARLAEDAIVRRPLALALGMAGRGSELARRVHRILAEPERALGRRAAAGVSGVLVAGLLGGGSALARCPQVVSFRPQAVAVAASSSPSTSRVGSERKVSFDTAAAPRLVRTTASMSSPASGIVVGRRRTVPRASLHVMVSDRARRPRRGWVVMAGWTVVRDGAAGWVPVRFAVPANYSISSYATLPVGNGWLVFQL